MNQKLAAELWLSIGKSSVKKDLNSLSQTSKFLTKLLRPLLYKVVDVQIKFEERRPTSFMHTLKLLSDDKHLAACIQEFHVRDPCIGEFIHSPSSFIYTYLDTFLKAVPNMTSLHTLQIHNCSSHETGFSLYDRLLGTLQSARQPIRDFYLRHWHSSGRLFPTDDESLNLLGMRVFKCCSISPPVYYRELKPS